MEEAEELCHPRPSHGADWCVSQRVCIRGFMELHLIPVRPALNLGPLTKMQTSSIAPLAGLSLTVAVAQR